MRYSYFSFILIIILTVFACASCSSIIKSHDQLYTINADAVPAPCSNQDILHNKGILEKNQKDLLNDYTKN